MRGIERTVMCRVYASDNAKLQAWLREYVRRNGKGTSADIVRAIIRENLLAKQRDAYNRQEVARMMREMRELREKLTSCEKVYTV